MVELSVNVPVRRCNACEFEYLDEESEQIKHDAVCRHLGVLPPIEIKRIRNQYGMTRAQFARLTGIGEASLNRWENGLGIQTHAYDRYLRLLQFPANNSHLERFLSLAVTTQAMDSTRRKFRAIEITDYMRKKQQEFQLYKVA